MAVIKAISSKASITTILNYVMKPEKTKPELITGLNCTPESVIDEMMVTKLAWRKTSGRTYKHFTQSFSPDESITPEQAHEIAVKLARHERFKGFEVLVSTHTDCDHLHSHVIVNSVNFENGKKFQESAKELQAFKDFSDELCREQGFSICEKGDEVTAYTKNKYKTLEKATTGVYKSYLLDCYNAVRETSSRAVSRDDFIEKMIDIGYDVNWSDNRKYITFSDMEGNKVRDSNLSKTFKESFGKDDLQHIFELNAAALEAADKERRRQELEIERRLSAEKENGIHINPKLFSSVKTAEWEQFIAGAQKILQLEKQIYNPGR